MENVINRLTVSGGSESAGFLNDIVEQLWPNINTATAQIIKDVVEPMFASVLPTPLSGLRFAKVDLGHVPIRFSKVDVHKTTLQGIKLDMDLDWDGACDIELTGKMVPKIGIEKIKMKGRLTILLCPLTNIIPLIGAAQVAFINPPSIKLDFTDAANIADCFLIEKTVRNIILGIISSMAVLPNRYLVKLDANNDYFKTYQPHHGFVRLTVEKAENINAPKKSGISGFLSKIAKDTPDCFVEVQVGAEEKWRTSVKNNDLNPVWNESHEFLVMDYEQAIFLDVRDDDVAGADDMGFAQTTIKTILLNGGSQSLDLTHNGENTGSIITVHAKLYDFVTDSSLLSARQEPGEDPGRNQICGLVTILVASALGLSGQRDELRPSIKVHWGQKEFITAEKVYVPGTDIFNPAFDQSFTFPLTSAMMTSLSEDFSISLLNGKDVIGSIEVPFQNVLDAPELTLRESFDVGGGAFVRAGISIHTIQAAV